MTDVSRFRASVIACAMLLAAACLIALIDERTVIDASQALPVAVEEQNPPRVQRGHEMPVPVDTVPPRENSSPVAPDPLAPYRGVGAWVDLFDFAKPGKPSPEAIVTELHRQGVKTLFLQAGRWNLPADPVIGVYLDQFLHHSHRRGMFVIGWWLPGFGDLERDVGGSLAVVNYQSAAGDTFDGFGADIEDKRGVNNSVPVFNMQVAEYSRRLRAALPGRTLAAIVPDAKNNERAPWSWAGFPWPDIAHNYDVIMPMGYWTVTKPRHCPHTDSAAYTHEVVAKTKALMGADKPIHPIGGIADCMTANEVSLYVLAARDAGAIGRSLYDFDTIHARGDRDAIWAELRK